MVTQSVLVLPGGFALLVQFKGALFSSAVIDIKEASDECVMLIMKEVRLFPSTML